MTDKKCTMTEADILIIGEANKYQGLAKCKVQALLALELEARLEAYKTTGLAIINGSQTAKIREMAKEQGLLEAELEKANAEAAAMRRVIIMSCACTCPKTFNMGEHGEKCTATRGCSAAKVLSTTNAGRELLEKLDILEKDNAVYISDIKDYVEDIKELRSQLKKAEEQAAMMRDTLEKIIDYIGCYYGPCASCLFVNNNNDDCPSPEGITKQLLVTGYKALDSTAGRELLENSNG
jgi:hypothetical protein